MISGAKARVVLALATALAVASCSTSAASPTTSTTPSAPAVSPVVSGTTTGAYRVAYLSSLSSINDHAIGQYTYEGVKTGAAAIGASAPAVIVPKDNSEYARDIQSFVDGGADIIVTVTSDQAAATVAAAKANPKVHFIGLDQSPICIDLQGSFDSTGKCPGDAATLLPNYTALGFQEDQVGYLAGMVAAGITKTGVVGAIGGISTVPPVVRYIQGYQLGAKAVNPRVNVSVSYVSASDFGKAFNDPATGQTFATQFIQQTNADVLFAVAGNTGNGVLDAACRAGIYAIGVDVDQSLSYPNAASCLVTSAEKHIANATEQAIRSVAAGSFKPGDLLFNAKNDGVGLAPYGDKANLISADLQAKIDAALAAMKAGTLTTCPATCGQP